MPFFRSFHDDDHVDHMGGRRDIEVQGLATSRRCEDRRVGDCRL
jgi:hypothetical protein